MSITNSQDKLINQKESCTNPAILPNSCICPQLSPDFKDINPDVAVKLQLSLSSATLLYNVVFLLPDFPQSEISKQLKIHKSTVSRYVVLARCMGFITEIINSRPRFYRLTKSGRDFLKSCISSKKPRFSQGVRKPPIKSDIKPKTRIENTRIKYAIVSDKYIVSDWSSVNQKFNNWIPKYLKIDDFPFKISIEKTTKSILIFLSPSEFSRDFDFVRHYTEWLIRSLHFIPFYLNSKLGIQIDPMSVEIINQEFANPMPEYNTTMDPKTRVRIDLGRKASSVLGTTKQDAKAWVDRSHGDVEVESNDLTYQNNLIRMPESVSNLNDIIPEFTEGLRAYTDQITKHLDIMGEIGDSQVMQTKVLSHLDLGIQSLVDLFSPPKSSSPNHSGPSFSDYLSVKAFWAKKGKRI